MLIGVPKEIKDHEDRVGLVSASVHELVAHGHRVLVETGAGQGAGVFDTDFERAGAAIADSAAKIWSTAELIVKVKEPLASSASNCVPGKFFSPICISPPIPSRPTI